jgi:hypothetical protein
MTHLEQTQQEAEFDQDPVLHRHDVLWLQYSSALLVQRHCTARGTVKVVVLTIDPHFTGNVKVFRSFSHSDDKGV